MSKQTNYKPSEVYNLLKTLIEANDKIIAKGGIPTSLSIVGSPGLGKTTICRELSADLGRGFFKLNLAQLTEPSELVGYYSKEYKVAKVAELVTGQKGEEQVSDVQWVTENMLPKYAEDGFQYQGETRTKPCPPDWVVNLTEGSILCLDDYSRSNSLFSQAIMELVNENTMIGWDLKAKKVQILLTENPDDGEYNVSSYDKAQTDRMMRINLIWDAKDWADRAEKIGTDERLINFVLWAPELFEQKKAEGISASGNVSPRMMDKFFALVSTIDDFEKHLDKISLFGDISVGKEITSQLTNFINKRLDKLPSVADLLIHDDLKTSKTKLTLCCGDYEKDPNNWKSGTAAILTTRMYNFVRHKSKEMTKDNIKQYLECILHPSFSIDQKFLLVKQTVSCGNNFAQILAGDPRFIPLHGSIMTEITFDFNACLVEIQDMLFRELGEIVVLERYGDPHDIKIKTLETIRYYLNQFDEKDTEMIYDLTNPNKETRCAANLIIGLCMIPNLKKKI